MYVSTWLTVPGMVHSCTKWLQLHEVTCYFGAIRTALVMLMSKFSCFGVQWFSLTGKRSPSRHKKLQTQTSHNQSSFDFHLCPGFTMPKWTSPCWETFAWGLGKLFKFTEPIVLSFKKNIECVDFETSFSWRTVSSFSKSVCFIQPI